MATPVPTITIGDGAARGLPPSSPSQSSLLKQASVADHQTINDAQRFTVRFERALGLHCMRSSHSPRAPWRRTRFTRFVVALLGTGVVAAAARQRRHNKLNCE